MSHKLLHTHLHTFRDASLPSYCISVIVVQERNKAQLKDKKGIHVLQQQIKTTEMYNSIYLHNAAKHLH